MIPARFPALFVSHGAPTLALDPTPTHAFLGGLGDRLGTPDAILVVTAHWLSEQPVVSAAPRPETIHDFYGFPEPLYRLRYPAPGAPDVAAEAAGLLRASGFPATLDAERGLDHGAWVPLLLMYPQAQVPVVQLSVQPRLSSEHHAALGAALKPLRERRVLILGSGALTHNLREYFGQPRETPEAEWVAAFGDWVGEAVARGDRGALLDYRAQAPFARRNHPTDEHLLPLFVALGAGAGAGIRLHRDCDHGVLRMDAFKFE
jgi:4,5-DOPA dioxygenase extradiol